MSSDEKLRVSIEEAFAGPGCIRVDPEMHRSAVTALGVHCLFVQAGFEPQNSETSRPSALQEIISLVTNQFSPRRTNYKPPDYWLSLLPSPEIIFRYTYPGKSGTFICHCSVKPETEQMLVHVAEEGNRTNIQVVGLQVNYTVPDSALKSLKQVDCWDDVFGDLALLTFNVETYLIEPVIASAMDDPQQLSYLDGKMTWRGRTSWLTYSALIIMFGLLTATYLRNNNRKSIN